MRPHNLFLLTTLSSILTRRFTSASRDSAAASLPTIIYGTAWKKDETQQYVQQALEAGFVAFDTANQPKHYFEAGVGEALSRFSEKVFVQTKFTHLNGQTNDHTLPYNDEASIHDQVLESFHSSLRNLQVNKVDSYLLHGPSITGPVVGEADLSAWETMLELQDAGKTQFVGVSNVNADQLLDIVKRSPRPPQIVQNRCVAEFGWDIKVRKLCKQYGISYQGFGLLTWSRHVLSEPIVQQIASMYDVTPAQVILKFAIQLGITPVVGPKRVEHMEHDLSLSSFQLSEEQIDALEQIGGPTVDHQSSNPESVLTIQNFSAEPILVYWVNAIDGGMVLQGRVGPSDHLTIKTYIGHKFVSKWNNDQSTIAGSELEVTKTKFSLTLPPRATKHNEL